MRPKVFQLLLFLLEHRGHVVSKQALYKQVWPNQHISNATLESTLRAVRHALGDSGRTQQMIQTHHGFGYRFVTSVTVRPEETPGRETPTAPAQDSLDAEPHSLLSLGERKLVTLLCCVLANVSQVDVPQELDTLHDRMRVVHDLARDEVHRYGGTIQPVTGEHLLAVFGAPIAQEDHAPRTALAALGLHQRIEAYRRGYGILSAASPAVRMGVHTGMVVWGGLGGDGQTFPAVVGDTALLATSLAHHAKVGTILCSTATASLVREVVRLREVHPVSVAGQPVSRTVYQVVASMPQRTPARQYGRRFRGVFVGREREMVTLHALLAQVENGRGQVAGIVGEPGVGKSRLVAEFRHSLRGRCLTYLAGRCVSYGQETPYLPLSDLLWHNCGIMATDSAATITAKVRQSLHEVGMEPDAWAPYILGLVGIATDEIPA
jgi:class 3 adenylate cyclase